MESTFIALQIIIGCSMVIGVCLMGMFAGEKKKARIRKAKNLTETIKETLK